MKFTFIDWDSVSNTISRIHHDTSGTSRGVQSEHSLDGNIHGRGVERLEHNLCHLFSVSFRVKGGLCQEDWVFLWGYTELVVESMMPDLKGLYYIILQELESSILEQHQEIA